MSLFPRRHVLGALGAALLAPRLASAQDAFASTAWPAGRPTPALDAPDLDGKSRTLADWRGRVLVLNFWASWCAPCRTELPSLAQLAQFHGGEGVAVATVNFKESARLVRRFLEPRGLDLAVLLDPAGTVAARWGVKIFPTTFLVDAGGRVRWSVRGEADWTGPEATRLISTLLKTP
ncbi:TlpA family protein disulfide reductase [Ramlibacter sp.]|uniref:TlpA family protein disulfide reductase n=1 Tax=Ramlibacter sp. TaxID=1917967 RepID=UPI003D152A0D